MKKTETLEVIGVIDVLAETGEASITVFEENDNFIDEKEYNILELLEGFDGKTVKITVEHSNKGVE